ncbi:hypothetical protein ACWC9T_41210 [Kitasatospora sp. NPDC001159]
MPETRSTCARPGSYAALRARAALGGLAGRDSAAPAYAQNDQSRHAVDDCLSSTTTLCPPVYAFAALLTAFGL